jgi:hypothetical protein
MILARAKVQEAQGAWAKAHEASIAAGLSPSAGPEEAIVALIRSLVKMVEEKAEAMVAADEAHAQELLDDTAPRDARDAAADAVGELLQFARSNVSSQHGPRALTVAGLGDPISQDPAALVVQARQFVKAASAKDLELPAPKLAGFSNLDLPALAKRVEAKVPALEAAISKVAVEDAEAQSTLRAKNAALDAFEAAFSPVNGVLYNLAVLAGLREIADKLPSLPRSKAKAADEESDGEPGAGAAGAPG